MTISEELATAIENYLGGNATEGERQLVDTWYHSFDDRKLEITTHERGLKKKIDMMIRARLAETTGVRSIIEVPVVRLNVTNVKRWTAVAAIFIAFTVAIYFYIFKNASTEPGKYTADIAPARNTAILTLGNGHKIILSDKKKGQLVSEAGVSITKTSDGQLVYTVIPSKGSLNAEELANTIETPKGGKYQVSLPDGTRVWLNSASSLRYPLRFNDKQRKVELDGEAYFEVAKLRHLPFLVVTKKQTVEVLGTHFNINSYSDENSVKTTLLEGSVRVSSSGAKHAESILKPGQQSVLQSDELKVKEADLTVEMAWKNGEFIFTNNDFRAEMRKVARWYDVDVVYDDSAPMDVDLDGFISREKNISALLTLIELTGKVHFKIQGRRIVVTK
jgi:transmembrane sensor